VIEIDGPSRDEKLELLERLWESLTSSKEPLSLSDGHREVLDQRLDELERVGAYGVPADEVLARLRGRNE
jgi:putative addiction module component (TIGR02574 family)